MESNLKFSGNIPISLNEQFGWGQNMGRKRTALHFAASPFDDNPDDIPESKINTDTKGENCEELNCLNLNVVKVYIGSAASRETYIENTTNGSCED